MKDRKYYLLIGVFLLFSILLTMIVTQNRLIGEDSTLHLELSNAWFEGKIPFITPDNFRGGYPYPPFLHLLVAFLARLFFSTPFAVMIVLQFFTYTVVCLGTIYLVYDQFDLRASVFTLFLLASSPAFWDRSVQVIPQAVDMFLIPVSILLYLKDKNVASIAAFSIIILNHSLYAVPLFIVFSLDGVFKKRYNWLKFGIPVFLILMGGMFFLGHGTDAVVQAGDINNAQEASIRMNPILFGVKYLGLPLLIGTVLLIFKFKKLVKTDLGRITLYWIIGLFTVLIWWYPDRFIEYVTQPIAIGAGYILTESKVGGALLPSLVIYGFGMILALFASLYFSNSIGFDLTGINPFPNIM